MADEGTSVAPVIDGGTATATPAVVSDPTATDWRSGMTDEHRADGAIAGMADAGALAQGFVDARAKASIRDEQTVTIPTKESTPEQINEFQIRLGRPDSADKYELPTEGMPASFQPDNARIAAVREAAFKMGVSRDQFAALVRADAEYADSFTNSQNAEQTAKLTTWDQQLHETLGAAYDQDTLLAKAAVLQFGGDKLKAAMDETGLGSHPEMILAWAKVGRALKSDEVLGRGSGATPIPTVQQANDEIMKRQADPDYMKSLEKRHHPLHEVNLREWQELNKQATPTKETVAAEA